MESIKLDLSFVAALQLCGRLSKVLACPAHSLTCPCTADNTGKVALNGRVQGARTLPTALHYLSKKLVGGWRWAEEVGRLEAMASAHGTKTLQCVSPDPRGTVGAGGLPSEHLKMVAGGGNRYEASGGTHATP